MISDQEGGERIAKVGGQLLVHVLHSDQVTGVGPTLHSAPLAFPGNQNLLPASDCGVGAEHSDPHAAGGRRYRRRWRARNVPDDLLHQFTGSEQADLDVLTAADQTGGQIGGQPETTERLTLRQAEPQDDGDLGAPMQSQRGGHQWRHRYRVRATRASRATRATWAGW